LDFLGHRRNTLRPYLGLAFGFGLVFRLAFPAAALWVGAVAKVAVFAASVAAYALGKVGTRYILCIGESPASGRFATGGFTLTVFALALSFAAAFAATFATAFAAAFAAAFAFLFGLRGCGLGSCSGTSLGASQERAIPFLHGLFDRFLVFAFDELLDNSVQVLVAPVWVFKLIVQAIVVGKIFFNARETFYPLVVHFLEQFLGKLVSHSTYHHYPRRLEDFDVTVLDMDRLQMR
jgi:hypothetical protein